MTDAGAMRLAVLIDSASTTASLTTELLEEIGKRRRSTSSPWCSVECAGTRPRLAGAGRVLGVSRAQGMS